ncbi:Photosystem I assembly protein Ycf3 [anaerobic digester metagenome]
MIIQKRCNWHNNWLGERYCMNKEKCHVLCRLKSRSIISKLLVVSILVFVLGLVNAEQTGDSLNTDSDFKNNETLSNWLIQGENFFENGDFVLALKNYQNAYEISPDDSDILYKIGLTHLMLGNMEIAEQYFNDSIRKNGNPEVLFYHGVANYGLKRYSQSIKSYGKYLDFYPNDSYALFNLGQAYEQDGKYNFALQAYENATRVDPSYAKPWYFIGVLYGSFGDHRKARDFYAHYSELEPDDHRGWFALSQEEYWMNNVNESVTAIEHAIHLRPDNSAYLDYLKMYSSGNNSHNSKNTPLSVISTLVALLVGVLYYKRAV